MRSGFAARAGAAVGALLLLLLAGCAAGDRAATPPDAQPESTVEPMANSVWPELPTGLLATGALEGAAQGEVQLVNKGDGFVTVRIEGLSLGISNHSGAVALPYRSYPDESCGARTVAWDFGWNNDEQAPDADIGTFPLDAFAGDPSLLREIIIRDFDSPLGTDECSATPAAKAVLEWTYEPLRAGLAAVDNGPTGGAQGEPHTVDSEITHYTVATNDLIQEVAARFQLTAEDIRYLNPELSPKLRDGETIVLNSAYR